MAKKTIKAQMQQRRDTAANWAANNPVLLDGELGIVSDDSNQYKIGDGVTAWNSLPLRGFDGTVVQQTGDSETAVMSQKVTSENINRLSSLGWFNNENDFAHPDTYITAAGVTSPLTGFGSTDYILVPPGVKLKALKCYMPKLSGIAFYDADKNFTRFLSVSEVDENLDLSFALEDVEVYFRTTFAYSALPTGVIYVESNVIPDGSIDAAKKIKEKTLLSKAINDTIFDFTSAENEQIVAAYEQGIHSVYIDPYHFNDITSIDLWCFTDNLYVNIADADGEHRAIWGKPFSEISPYLQYNCIVNGVIVGYVSFRDTQKFLDNPTNISCHLNLDVVTSKALNLAYGAPSEINFEIPDGSITKRKMAALSIGTAQLINNAVTSDKLAASSVTSDKLAASSVTSDKLALKFFATPASGYEAIVESYEAGLQDIYIDKGLIPDNYKLLLWTLGPTLYVANYVGADLDGDLIRIPFTAIENYHKIDITYNEVIIGYIVFRDKQKWIDAPTNVGQCIDMDYATSVPQHSYLRADSKVSISLPDTIYAVVGDTLQLFYRGIILANNPYAYDLLIECSKGKQLPRYFEYTPSASDIGSTTFRMTLYDDARNIIAKKECTLKTVNLISSPGEELKVMCFGDSLTANGEWVHELDRRLTGSDGSPAGKGLNNISFVGSKYKDGTGYFGAGGWQWSDYTTEGKPAFRFQVTGVETLTVGAVYTNNGHSYTIKEINVTNGDGSILCSVSSSDQTPTSSGTLTKVSGSGDSSITFTSYSADSQNPLWDYEKGKMTFVPYAEKVSGGKIDVVYTLLTWNGHNAATADFSAFDADIRTFLDTLHSEFPDAKVKMMGINVPSINGGCGYVSGTGAWANNWLMTNIALSYNSFLQEIANESEYRGFVEFVNVSSQFDSEHNFPYIEKDVNTRNVVKERIETNNVHPTVNGYLQIGDIVYRNFIANFCQ